MAGTWTPEEFIRRCRADKFQEFTSNDINEISKQFNQMHQLSQISKHEKYQVFDFHLFIRYIGDKDFMAARKALNGALREYELVLKLFEAGTRRVDALIKARDESIQLTLKTITPNTKQREKQFNLNREGVNDPKLNNTEFRYIEHPRVNKDYIYNSNFKEDPSLKQSLKDNGSIHLAAHSNKKKNAENSVQSHPSVKTRNREHLMIEQDKHRFTYSSKDPNLGDQLNETEKKNRTSDHSQSKPNYRSRYSEPIQNVYGKNEGTQNNNSEGDKKGDVWKLPSDTTIPLSFQIENIHESVKQRSIRHGRSNEGERKIEPGRSTYMKSDTDTRRYKDTQNRRSEEASLLLRQGNPNIVDLSDSNRPTNIAERFSELYSNEYTDAFEFLQKQGLTEEIIVYYLLRIVRHAYEYCRKRASEELSRRKRSVQRERKTSYEYFTSEKEERIIKGLGAKRLKIDALTLSKEVCDTFMKKDYWRLVPNGIDPENNYLFTYTLKCVDIVWFMSVQDPPILISYVKKGDLFDISLYRSYTKSGTIVDFCVWPLVLLDENGPILSKGIAQGK